MWSETRKALQGEPERRKIEIAQAIQNNAHAFVRAEQPDVLPLLRELKANSLIRGYLTAELSLNMSKNDLLGELQEAARRQGGPRISHQEEEKFLRDTQSALVIFGLQTLFEYSSCDDIDAVSELLIQLRSRGAAWILAFSPTLSFGELQHRALKGDSAVAMRLVTQVDMIGE